ncbi:MAG: HAD-IA family hydrolase [Acidobacteria bacterium]|nr:HAD-IA family hydrolase [Acidobacteriota bacterium]
MGDLRRLIVFDLDGTLIDSRRDLAESANQLIGELGGAPLAEEAVGRMVGEGAAMLVRRALEAAGIHVPLDTALPRFLAIYDARLLNHTRLYDGIADAVRLAGRYARLAVLTNKPTAPTERILTGLGVRELFDEVIGGDGALPRKPDPAPVFTLMERAGATTATTLLVGDSVIDHETARRASVRCCLATYGFGYATFPPGRLTGEEWIAADPWQLKEVLQRFTGGG